MPSPVRVENRTSGLVANRSLGQSAGKCPEATYESSMKLEVTQKPTESAHNVTEGGGLGTGSGAWWGLWEAESPGSTSAVLTLAGIRIPWRLIRTQTTRPPSRISDTAGLGLKKPISWLVAA